MKKRSMYGTVLLLTAALIWGGAFTAQTVGMDSVGPFTLQALRLLIGSIVLWPLVIMRRRQDPARFRRSIHGGFWCGVALCAAVNVQQIGLQYTGVGKAAFLTTMYVLLVPLFGLLLHKPFTRRMMLCVLLAVIGLFLLCQPEAGIQKGDVLELAAAAAFAVQILVIDHYSEGSDGITVSSMQFLTAGLISCVPMLLFEQPAADGIWAARIPILYMGVMSCGIAYTLQTVGQKYVAPATASVLLSMESIFSLLCGMLLLHQMPTVRELAGCAIMMMAVLLCQLPEKQG